MYGQEFICEYVEGGNTDVECSYPHWSSFITREHGITGDLGQIVMAFFPLETVAVDKITIKTGSRLSAKFNH